jgi:hypothetical protein
MHSLVNHVNKYKSTYHDVCPSPFSSYPLSFTDDTLHDANFVRNIISFLNYYFPDMFMHVWYFCVKNL